MAAVLYRTKLFEAFVLLLQTFQLLLVGQLFVMAGVFADGCDLALRIHEAEALDSIFVLLLLCGLYRHLV